MVYHTGEKESSMKEMLMDKVARLTLTHHNIQILLLGWWVNLIGQQCCGCRGKHQCYVGYDRGIWGLVADKEDIKDEEMKYKISKPREALWSHRLCFQIFTIVQTSIVPWLRASPVEWSALNNVFRIIISNQWLFTIFLDIINNRYYWPFIFFTNS